MRHRVGRTFVIALEGTPRDVDTWGYDEPIIGESSAIGEAYAPGIAVNRSRACEGNLHTLALESVVTELLYRKITQTDDDFMAERTGGDGPVRLHEGHREFWFAALEHARASCSGKAAANHHDASGTRLCGCQTWCTCRQRGSSAKETAAGEFTWHGTSHCLNPSARRTRRRSKQPRPR